MTDFERSDPLGLWSVFPWWQLVGAVVSVGVLITVDSSPIAAATFWGPSLGITVRDRLQVARRKGVNGTFPNRREVVGPPLLAPAGAALCSMLAVGLGLMLNVLFDGAQGDRLLVGAVLFITPIIIFGVSVLLVRKRRRPRSLATPETD